MQSLLRWSIENSSPDSPALTQPRKPVDPNIINYILGPSPAQQMEDALIVATDNTVEEGEDEEDGEHSTGTRMQALANLEMLVQDIDNAKHLTNQNMKMWKQVQQLLTSPQSSPNIAKQTLWVIGTAIQNSPEAQNAYLELKPIPALLSFLGNGHPSGTRSKAAYAISALLKHNKAAVDALDAAGGWEVFKAALRDPSTTIPRKISFLISVILLPTDATSHRASDIQDGPALHGPTSLDIPMPPPEPTERPTPVTHPNSHASMVSDPSSADTSSVTLKAMREHKVLDVVVATLVDGQDEVDAQVRENCVKILYTFMIICDNPLSQAEKSVLREYLDEHSKQAGGDEALAKGWDLEVDELKVLKKKLMTN